MPLPWSIIMQNTQKENLFQSWKHSCSGDELESDRLGSFSSFQVGTKRESRPAKDVLLIKLIFAVFPENLASLPRCFPLKKFCIIWQLSLFAQTLRFASPYLLLLWNGEKRGTKRQTVLNCKVRITTRDGGANIYYCQQNKGEKSQKRSAREKRIAASSPTAAAAGENESVPGGNNMFHMSCLISKAGCFCCWMPCVLLTCRERERATEVPSLACEVRSIYFILSSLISAFWWPSTWVRAAMLNS